MNARMQHPRATKDYFRRKGACHIVSLYSICVSPPTVGMFPWQRNRSVDLGHVLIELRTCSHRIEFEPFSGSHGSLVQDTQPAARKEALLLSQADSFRSDWALGKHNVSVSACSSCSAVRDCVMWKHTCTGKWQHTCSPGLCMLWKNFPRSPMGNGNVSERWCAGSCFRAVSERFQASLGLSLVSLQFFCKREK